ncbi:MAG: hypothetical protein NZO16_04450 [Deltaproteobacteria bacterium]|nr:hypothetical protein [Deltaproteobacteria bacterium]
MRQQVVRPIPRRGRHGNSFGKFVSALALSGLLGWVIGRFGLPSFGSRDNNLSPEISMPKFSKQLQELEAYLNQNKDVLVKESGLYYFPADEGQVRLSCCGKKNSLVVEEVEFGSVIIRLHGNENGGMNQNQPYFVSNPAEVVAMKVTNQTGEEFGLVYLKRNYNSFLEALTNASDVAAIYHDLKNLEGIGGTVGLSGSFGFFLVHSPCINLESDWEAVIENGSETTNLYKFAVGVLCVNRNNGRYVILPKKKYPDKNHDVVGLVLAGISG